jgi:hypothetical protein
LRELYIIEDFMLLVGIEAELLSQVTNALLYLFPDLGSESDPSSETVVRCASPGPYLGTSTRGL